MTAGSKAEGLPTRPVSRTQRPVAARLTAMADSICDVPAAATSLSVDGAVDALGVAARVGDVGRVVVVLVDGMGWHLLPAPAHL